ncbi:MAG: glycosyltransferase family 2 protein [Paenibacillus lautus]|jgi:hypothetical protein|uniref:glycosyltransferase family 2 protein n=1 Tax=Paenibacillus lautus TaxID=1401 RepID=UPI0026ED69E8|nr:glycosyltransferase family A protein [Paenibacillus lautus]MCI1776810.1 glycosyltransferase family 2 protein [Paenibacillus lautus]
MTAMLVFILPGLYPHLSENTATSVKRTLIYAFTIVIPSEEETGAIMNDALAQTNDPWFMTLFAGDALLPQARIEMERWLTRSSDRSAGYMINQGAITNGTSAAKNRRASSSPMPRGPVLWRTKYVMDGQNSQTSGFAAKDQLPFQKYVLIDKQLQLSTRYEWTEVDSEGILYDQRAAPAWMKQTEEWESLFPLLQAGAQASQAPIAVRPPLVTIGLCTYNDGAYLPWAVRSVLAQTSADWELIIYDDGSTDEDTANYRRNLPPDSRIKLVRQEANTGKWRALNQILNMAAAPWLLELDADDWLAPRALEFLLRGAEEEQQAAVIYANHVEWLERTNQQLVLQGVKAAPSSLSPGVLLNDASAVAPRMFNVSMLKQLRGWDHQAFYDGKLYEDIGQLMKLSSTHKLHHVPEALYHRRLRRSSMTHRHPGHYMLWKNSLLGKTHALENGHQSKGQNTHE